MIAVDASAVLAILLNETDAMSLRGRLAQSPRSVMSAVNYWEALARAEVIHGQAGHALVEELMTELKIAIADVDAAMAREAAAAFARYRGRPARLNLGDCFAYALAQREGDGLLFKGGDFPRTDISPALP
ncbi:MAG TPA: type II toxin-antitoxin system VapC family toxin [Caulobacteraceae bacterium]